MGEGRRQDVPACDNWGHVTRQGLPVQPTKISSFQRREWLPYPLVALGLIITITIIITIILKRY